MRHLPRKIILATLIAFFLFQNIADGKSQEQRKSAPIPSEKIVLRKISAKQKIKEGEVIVKFKKNKVNLKNKSGKAKIQNFRNLKNLQEINSADNLNAKLFKSDKTTAELIAELEKDPNVEYAEANTVRHPLSIPNDTYFSSQWFLHNIGQSFQSSTASTVSGTVDADIDATEAWDTENSANQEVIVAVIDTGARFSHEDLTANMWDGTICKDENNVSIPGGCPNHGWDYRDNDSNPDDSSFLYCNEYDTDGVTCLVPEEEISGHGTFISGIIGGVHNNSKGVSGISSKNKIKIMPIRFDLDTFTEIKAISFAKNNGAKVINASFGSDQISQIEKDAIEAFPGIFVAAAGNGDTNGIGLDNDAAPLYPASYDSANIISVAATDQNDALGTFSNFGNTSVDIAAPGVNVSSTYKNSDASYAVGDGTSFAAPFIAASSAMLFSVNSSLSIAEAKNILLTSGDSLPSLANKTVSGKRLNLNNAVQSALSTPPAAPTSLLVQ